MGSHVHPGSGTRLQSKEKMGKSDPSRRDSSVGTVIRYKDDRLVGVRVPVKSSIFSASYRPVLRPTQIPIQWVPGAFSPRVKR
jgi:hypothetical protein